MKKIIALILAALLALSMLTAATAAAYTDKDTVKKVQQALNDAGYNCGTPDGVAGKKTAAAITQYQTDKGLEATGTIDDALLQAMGLAEGQPDSEGPLESEAQAKPAEGEAEQGLEAAQELNLSDPQVLANFYNDLFLERLSDLGIDIANEDIGQKAYLLSSLSDEAWGYDLKADEVSLVLDNDEPSLAFSKFGKEGSLRDLNFLDHAALYAFCTVVNTYFQGNENDLSLLEEYFEKTPDRDGVISVESMGLIDPEVHNRDFSSYKLLWFRKGSGDAMAFNARPKID